ncbi:MAG: Crp/Fnr family transcriptional regulator [bacterium]
MKNTFGTLEPSSLKTKRSGLILEEFPVFATLSKEHLSNIEKITRQILLKKGSVLFSPGDAAEGFYAVLDGALRMYRVSPKGKEITLEIAGLKSTFAEASLFSDTYHCFAEALKDSELYLIRKAEFLNMIREDIQFAMEWIRILSMQVIHLRQRIEELSLKSPRAKISSYIILLAEMQNSSSVTLPVHRKAIATLLGMTQETFYRTAKELENERIVHFDGQKVEIINYTLLEEMFE